MSTTKPPVTPVALTVSQRGRNSEGHTLYLLLVHKKHYTHTHTHAHIPSQPGLYSETLSHTVLGLC